MTNLLSYLPFVKDQALFHERQAGKQAALGSPKREAKHRNTAASFHALGNAIEEAQAKIDAPQAAVPDSQSFALKPEDLVGLPADLLAQLNITDADKLEAAIVDVINEAGGTISLDKLLIGLYRKTQEVHQRQQLVNRLYRMSKKGLVFSVPKRKGIYTTNPALGVETAEEGPIADNS